MLLVHLAAPDTSSFDIDSIKKLMDGLDPATLLPKISSITGSVTSLCRIAILAAPIVLLVLGLAYLLLAPKEANYYFGYRTTFGMGSVSAWRRTQKLAGFVFAGVGGVLTVIMGMVSATFGSMEAMDVVWRALRCLIWEAAAAVIAIAAINIVTAMTFDYKGNRRNKK